jgi:FMN-dependent NADH-azoreductase
MKLLHIDSSILGETSASRKLTGEIVARWRDRHPGLQVKYLDLAAEALPHFTVTDESGRNAAVLQDFLDADVIVIGAPMYNFSIPSQLKAWIDRVTVAGETFRYTESGPKGLAGGKQVIVGISRGGVYAPDAPGEFAESYLKFLFGFLGIDSVTFVRAEGLALSPEHRRTGIASALAVIEGSARQAA